MNELELADWSRRIEEKLRKENSMNGQEDSDMASSDSAVSQDDTINGSWLKDHLKSIETSIWNKAREIAKKDGRSLQPRDVYRAADAFAPGDEIRNPRPARTIAENLALSISGVTLISALLAFTFGLIAWAAARNSPDVSKAAWDAVKLFSGAIVGSAGANISRSETREAK